MLQTVDADANQAAEETPVCGSSFCFAAAAVETAFPAETDATTAVCGSFFCSAAAVDSAVASAAETDADANLNLK